jgi:hypothetical protein
VFRVVRVQFWGAVLKEDFDRWDSAVKLVKILNSLSINTVLSRSLESSVSSTAGVNIFLFCYRQLDCVEPISIRGPRDTKGKRFGCIMTGIVLGRRGWGEGNS